MATSGISFKIPQETRPLPSLECDEESFVVLGQSISDCSNDGYVSPVDFSVITEAKKLLNSELEALEQSKDNPEENRKSLIASQDLAKMVTSSDLPVMPAIEKGFETANTISITSFTPDMCSEEFQNKISYIIDENISLKNTIIQNNMTLKSQYEKIIIWQEDVKKVHEAHKEKLLEAKNIIEKLKQEKKNLISDITQSTESKNNSETEIAALKRALKEKESATNEVLVQRSDENIKEFQLEVANKKIKELEADILKVKSENQKLTDDLTKIQENMADKKEFQLDVANKKIRDLEMENETLVTEKKNANKKQDELEMATKTVNEQLLELTLREKEEHENIKKLESELKLLKGELEKSNRNCEELKNELLVRTQRENALIMTNNVLRTQTEKSDDHTEEINNLRTQLTQLQTSLTQTEYSRGQAYAQVNQLTQELSKMAKDLTHARAQTNQNDEVWALKVQLDVYKTDFDEERHAREVIKGEKDRLEEDIQNLQRRNQQLQEEIEMIRAERDFEVYPSQASFRQAPRPVAPPNEESSYKCPKCGFGFSSVTQLQNHVYRCIELDDHLP